MRDVPLVSLQQVPCICHTPEADGGGALGEGRPCSLPLFSWHERPCFRYQVTGKLPPGDAVAKRRGCGEASAPRGLVSGKMLLPRSWTSKEKNQAYPHPACHQQECIRREENIMSPLAVRRHIFLMRFKVHTEHLGLKTMFARRPPDILFCISAE